MLNISQVDTASVIVLNSFIVFLLLSLLPSCVRATWLNVILLIFCISFPSFLTDSFMFCSHYIFDLHLLILSPFNFSFTSLSLFIFIECPNQFLSICCSTGICFGSQLIQNTCCILFLLTSYCVVTCLVCRYVTCNCVYPVLLFITKLIFCYQECHLNLLHFIKITIRFWL